MREQLKMPVGPGKPNLTDDVRLVQRLLDRQAARTGIVISQSGQFDHATQQALAIFQRRVMRNPMANGIVSPGDSTLQELTSTTAQRLMAGGAGGLRLPHRIGNSELAEEDFVAAAAALKCDVRSVKAVTAIEAPNGPFDIWGRPTLLFERHLFHRFTGGRHDRTAPDLSSANPGGYGRTSEQFGRLERAYALDATAALRATSWGGFQILGDNYARAGFGTVDLFVRAMCQSAAQQLTAFVAFIQFSPALIRAIDNRRWADFAKVYNGPNYKINDYDNKLEKAYEAAQP